MSTFLSVALMVLAAAPASAKDAAPTLELQVRVTGLDGKPSPAAKAQVRAFDPKDFSKTWIVPFPGGSMLTADQEGWIRTPKPLNGRWAYCVLASAQGYQPDFSQYLPANRRGDQTLPDVRLAKLLTIHGAVREPDGKPVANARVFHSGDAAVSTSTTTKEDGSFALPGAPEGELFLFVESKGHRFSGQLIDTRKGEPTLVVDRRDHPKPRTLQRRPLPKPSLSEAELRQEARAMLAPELNRVLSNGSDEEKDCLLTAMASVDPAETLALSRTVSFQASFARKRALHSVAYRIAEQSAEAGWAAARQMDDPEPASWILRYGVLQKIPKDDRRRRVEALEEYVALVRAGEDPRMKFIHLADTAEQLFQLGAAEQARALVEELEREGAFSGEGPQGKLYAAVAALSLARYDVERARKLCEQAGSVFPIRFAAAIAGSHPAQAEEVLQKAAFNERGGSLGTRNYQLPAICWKMAKVDPDRAERIARLAGKLSAADYVETLAARALSLLRRDQDVATDRAKMNVFLQAFVRGLIGARVLANDPARGRRLIDESVALLRREEADIVDPRYQFMKSPAPFLMALVPTVADVDPAYAREIFWWAVALRPPLNGREERPTHFPDEISRMFPAAIAMYYEPDVAEVQFAALLDRARRRSFGGVPPTMWIAWAVAPVRPDGLVDWVKSLPTVPTATGGDVRTSTFCLWSPTCLHAYHSTEDEKQRLLVQLAQNTVNVYRLDEEDP